MRPARLALLAPLLAAAAGAHDFWIDPSTLAPAVGEPVGVHLVVGESCEGEVLARNPQKVETFVVIGPSGRMPVAGEAGAIPAGELILREAGTHVVAYRGRRNASEMDADAFDAYLAAEGNEDVVAWRAAHGQEETPGREVFSRCAKAVLHVGQGDGGNAGVRLGWPLELVPLAARGDDRPRGTLEVLLLRNGVPLANHLVAAIRCDGASASVEADSGPDGVARLRIPVAGRWLVKAVKVVPAPEDVDADWESFWASLVLDVPEPPSPPAALQERQAKP